MIVVKYGIFLLNCVAIFYLADGKIFVAISLFFYLINNFVHVFLHEIGHFLGGCFTGYRLLYIQIFIFRVERTSTSKYTFCIKKNFCGECVMIPKFNPNKKVSYILYNSGGIILNFLVSAASFACLLIYDGILEMFFLQMLFVGATKFFVNAIPSNFQGLNDGYIIKILYNDAQARLDYCKYLELFSHCYLNEKFQITDYTYQLESKRTKYNPFYEEIKKLLPIN